MAAKNMDQEFMPPRVPQEKVIYEWTASSRPFKRRTREFYVNLGAIAVLFSLILLLIDGVMPVLLLAAMFFLFYVFSTVEPEKTEYQVTSFGIRIGDTIRGWEEIGRYWFATRMGQQVLVIETATPPWRLELVIDEAAKKKVDTVLAEYLYKNDSPDTVMDRTLGWVTDRLRA